MKHVILWTSVMVVVAVTGSILHAEDDIDVMTTVEEKADDVISIVGETVSSPASDVLEEQAGLEGRLLPVKTLPTISDAKWLCELFMLKLNEAGVQAAFRELRPYFSVPEEEFSMIQMQTIQQLEIIRPRYGKMIGYTLLAEDALEDVALRFTYVQKFERHAIRWFFYFYKPHDAWLFNEFYVDDKLRELFD